MNTRSTSPEFAAASIVSLMQGCNIMSIQMIIEVIHHDKSVFSKALSVGPFFLFLVINYIRYVYKETNDYKVMKERFSNEANHRIKGGLVLLYIIISFSLTLGLAIYLGSQKYN